MLRSASWFAACSAAVGTQAQGSGSSRKECSGRTASATGHKHPEEDAVFDGLRQAEKGNCLLPDMRDARGPCLLRPFQNTVGCIRCVFSRTG
ncbi:hypothetical protein K466DRAFT_583100 [Polyporus arcularius HHB13444]|uniref:Uncharacterized protein n=1 Tax=Polyporus arcularius HHB13444 TaxID=1314778 RepID=A0A5C3PP68_9APHY|nr:hypothetical protein K466DRAFT_583100 [Polyporus arcularius HHB13444]